MSESVGSVVGSPGVLKLLQLPTAPGYRLTLGEIREAYQLLKELYRTAP